MTAASDARTEQARDLPIEAGLLGRTVAWKSAGKGTERCGPCPICGGKDRFSINTAKGVWHCRGCAKGGDVISLARHVAGVGFIEALELLVGEPETKRRRLNCRAGATVPPETSRRREVLATEQALEVWSGARESRGTIVDRHFESRELVGPDEDMAARVLRYHLCCPWREKGVGPLLQVPAMVALRRSILTDEPISIHRTRLSIMGEKLGRQNLGPSRGTAIKLDDDADVSMGLVIGEGIETCLAAHQLGLRPTWALSDANGISAFPVLSGIEALTILAEDCPVNRKAIDACGERWTAAGRQVVVVRPRHGKDVNDAIRGGAA
jgi:hypothetical protein